MRLPWGLGVGHRQHNLAGNAYLCIFGSLEDRSWGRQLFCATEAPLGA